MLNRALKTAAAAKRRRIFLLPVLSAMTPEAMIAAAASSTRANLPGSQHHAESPYWLPISFAHLVESRQVMRMRVNRITNYAYVQLRNLAKFRHTFFIYLAFYLSPAPNQTLADVTSPPGYKSQLTPSPHRDRSTQIRLQILRTQHLRRKCAARHGDEGLGNGSKRRFAVGHPTVCPNFPTTPPRRGTPWSHKVDQFMPPFASLTDQER